MSVQLRPYQLEVKQAIYSDWRNGKKNVLAVMPTGAGKTRLFSDIVLDHHRAGMRSAVIAHRNELVSQMSCALAECDIEHRIIGSAKTVSIITAKHRRLFGKSFINPSAATAAIGVDTFVSRMDELKSWAEQVDLWVGDEWHHGIGRGHYEDNELIWDVEPNKWGKAVHMFKNARGLGVTATPQRADGQGLGRFADGHMDSMVVGPPTRWLIDNKYLCDYEIACPISDFHMEEDKRGKDGDFTLSAMRKASRNSKIVGDVVENYCKLAYGKKAIVFATDVETADHLAKKFNEIGIRAVSLNGNSDPGYREQSLEKFNAGEIRVLINVDLFDEGFDVPSCEVCIMARPTASLGKYLQMIGRVLRYVEGKIALIIDHVSNILRHKLPDMHRVWTLDRRDKRAKQVKDPDEIPLIKCKSPSCNKPYEAFRSFCPYCGNVPEPAEGGGRTIKQVAGDLILLDRDMLARLRASTNLESPADIAARVAKAAGNIAGIGASKRQIEKIAAQQKLKETIEQWVGCEQASGYTDSETQKRFFLTTGFDMLSALGNTRTAKDYEETEALVRSWYSK